MLFRLTLWLIVIGSFGWLLLMVAALLQITLDPGYEVGDSIILGVVGATSPIALGSLIVAAWELHTTPSIKRCPRTAKYHPLATTVFWEFPPFK